MIAKGNLLALLSVLFLTFFIFSTVSFGEEEAWVVSKISGDVKSLKNGEKVYKKVKSGDKFAIGDKILTGLESEVVLTNSMGDWIKIKSEATLIVEKVSDMGNKFQTEEGKILAKVVSTSKRKSSKDYALSVKSPTANAGVRGTVLAVEGEEVVCVEGNVDVKPVDDSKDSKVINIKEGEKVVVEKTKEAPKKEKASKSELDSYKAEVKAYEKKPEKKDTTVDPDALHKHLYYFLDQYGKK